MLRSTSMRWVNSGGRYLVAGLTVIALCAVLARAQISAGTLRGIVQDSTGARIASAVIYFRQVASPTTRSVFADDRGEFRVDDLEAGDYSVTVSGRGFQDAVANVSIAVGAVRDITVTLEPQGVNESVAVRAHGSSITTQPVDLAGDVHQGVITSRDLETFPLAARSFANIAYLVPGTEPVEPSDPTKARITAVSTGGSSGLNNEISVDGGDDSDDYIGGFLQNFSPDMIQEFTVRTGQEEADTGGTTAGSVIIATKNGTNNMHGNAAFYERAAALNARYPIENPAPNPKQPFSRQNYVATIGGPIKRNQLWFFTGFEGVKEDASIAYSPSSVTQFDALATLASEGLIPGVSSIEVPGNVPIPFRDYLGSERLDWARVREVAMVCEGVD